MASDPGGGFSDHEKFVLWKYCFENNLIPNTQTPPKGGLIEYGKRNGVITDADIETREGKYGNFRAIADFHTKLDILKHIGERYGFDVDPMIDAMLSNDSDTNSDSSTNTDSDQPTDSASQSESETQHTESQASDVESDSDGQESATSSAAERETTSTDTASASSTDTTSDDSTWTDTTPSSEGDQAPSDDTTDDDSAPVTVEEVSGQGKPDPDQLQDTTTNPDGPDASEIFDDESDSNNGETATDDTSETDEYIRFQTYEEPAESDDEYDVDAEAVRQFVDEFTITEAADQSDLKCHKQGMLDAFTVWSEINNIELDDLAPDEYDGHRKSDLFDVISEQQEINEGMYTVRGNRKRGYSGISLSENGEELLNISIE